MAIDLNLQNQGNPYDLDDPDHYMNRDLTPENSNLVPWMLGGMFAVATLIGLFFAEGSPLTESRHATQTTENVATHPTPAPFQAN